MKGSKAIGCLALVLVGLVLVLVGETVFSSPASDPARARKLAAEARRVELAADTYAKTDAARVAALSILYLGGATVAVLGAAGGVAVLLSKGLNWARATYPNAAGQFPLVRVGGRAWAGYLDPNRGAGPVTIIGGERAAGELAVKQPLALSEPATVQLAAQATALGMTAGATRYPTSGRANVLGAVEAVATSQVAAGPRALPPVEEEDVDHIDRLLLLTDGEVEEGEFREL